MELPSAVLIPSSGKNLKNPLPPQKKFVIPYISGNETFYISGNGNTEKLPFLGGSSKASKAKIYISP